MNSIPELNREALFATLADLIAINSVNPQYLSGPGEGALADYVGEFFKRNSIPFVYQPVFDGRPNVIGKLEGRPGGETLILEAHMDTASDGGMTIDPFQPIRKGNRMYGRGSCDTKGGLAAMMYALKALCDSKLRPQVSVLLLAAVDEEHAFRGVTKFLESGQKADGAIVAEPTDLQAAVASKGVLRWRIKTRGRAAHSSKPLLGINAIGKMAKLIVVLEQQYCASLQSRQHPLLGSPTLNVGVVQGGIQVNQVPESCTIEVDRRLLPGETRHQVWNEFEAVSAGLRAQDPEVEIVMEPPMLEDFPLETQASERIVQASIKASQGRSGRSELIGVPYGSDASKLARAGIPSIILGPGNIDQAHSADEYVELDQVAHAAEIYTRAILEF